MNGALDRLLLGFSLAVIAGAVVVGWLLMLGLANLLPRRIEMDDDVTVTASAWPETEDSLRLHYLEVRVRNAEDRARLAVGVAFGTLLTVVAGVGVALIAF